MDETTAKALIENPINLYIEGEEKGKKVEDLILEDRELLKQYAELWRTNEPALRTLVRVINANLVKYMVENATPVETVGLRHELQGAEKILRYLAKYSAEYERLTKKQDAEQEETDNKEAEEAPSTVEEGEESAL